MNCKELFCTIDALNDEYMHVWEDVCNIESPTVYKAGVDAVGKYFADMAEKHGWRVEYFEQPVSGNVVCITMNPDAKAAPVCLSGHMDTVHDIGLFGEPPVMFDGDKIRGPGVADCKGGIVAGFMAMDALERCGFTSRPVMLLLQSDEENGSSTSNKETIGYICERAKDAVAFLNMEIYSQGKACTERKGILTYKFTVHGKEAHSSNCAKEGANAIAEAAYKIIELEKLKDPDGITCSCGVISGGSVPNTVAGHCEFKVNIRVATREQLEWVCGYMQKIAETTHIPGCTCTLEQISYRVAMEKNAKNMLLLDTVNGIFVQNGLPQLIPSKRKGGSDAADVSSYGIPCLDGFGVEGKNIHSKDEYALVGSLLEAAKRTAAVIYCI